MKKNGKEVGEEARGPFWGLLQCSVGEILAVRVQGVVESRGSSGGTDSPEQLELRLLGGGLREGRGQLHGVLAWAAR